MSSVWVIIISVLLFGLIVILLTGLLLFAKNRLLPSGKVTININEGEKLLEVKQGDSLLHTLAEEHIYLPSACGGKGSCGMCRVRVTEGADTMLPTEIGFFTYSERRNHLRLACQVKVRGDLSVVIPPTILGVKKWECEVVGIRQVATFIRELRLRLPEGEHLVFHSGGYIQIDIPACHVYYRGMNVEEPYWSEWNRMKLFDLEMDNSEPTSRAYSMANAPEEGDVVMLNVRIATPPFDRAAGAFVPVNPGISSSYLYSLREGDRVAVSGPYGEFFLREGDTEMCFIGGGAGMAPMRSHIFHLFHDLKTTRRVTFWYGARSLREAFYVEDFDAIAAEFPNFSWHLALSEPLEEDGWTGDRGFIHQVLFNRYLQGHEEPEEIEYYLCGPPMMISACKTMLHGLGVPDRNIMYDDFGS